MINDDYALFMDDAFHNIGLGWQKSTGEDAKQVFVQLAPGIKVSIPNSVIDSVAELPPSDSGRYGVTQNPIDRW